MSCTAGKCSLASLQLLFAHGATMDNNALSAAARRGTHDSERVAIMDVLIAHGGDVNALEEGVRRPSSSALRTANPPRFTPLYEAARADDVQLVEFLLQRGADPRLRIRVGEREGTAPWAVMLASKDERMKALGASVREGREGAAGVDAE